MTKIILDEPIYIIAVTVKFTDLEIFTDLHDLDRTLSNFCITVQINYLQISRKNFHLFLKPWSYDSRSREYFR